MKTQGNTPATPPMPDLSREADRKLYTNIQEAIRKNGPRLAAAQHRAHDPIAILEFWIAQLKKDIADGYNPKRAGI